MAKAKHGEHDAAHNLLLALARAVERMTRMGVFKEHNAEIVEALAELEGNRKD